MYIFQKDITTEGRKVGNITRTQIIQGNKSKGVKGISNI